VFDFAVDGGGDAVAVNNGFEMVRGWTSNWNRVKVMPRDLRIRVVV
jgi:hypothetical protein